ncbi:MULTISPECIES: alanine dehydrogenase [Tenacibaculum]|uniref:alanine dehydrogenase n=1 Tax=Tenacibaculum mesophilum TaxID=104268 RepID=A0AAE9MK48_9FLAO|nr:MULTISPECIES: alanine dehydrogenase [Tenacibaculum]GFD75090.1 alanine dehydrogenase [Tenacibaculum sp. KUL113]GFD82107.1 alanine dehydrogenase [Tenacibaculum sp. KUL118]GFD92945.1 alanine dehydrogenase [Alteromonas sp. KUL154]GFD99160.1 alanine dehydrogenase [Alteromonas sp. KUL156]AZJ31633.1 alanine dehydrogenase [Tenacibaculum mesophilum]
MGSISPFTKEQLMPQTEMLEIKKQKGDLFIGLPKETHFEEKRISLSPDAVAALVAHGHRIVIETGAGEGANYSDQEYSDAGAKISYDIKEAFACNIVLKVEPPSLEEIQMLNPQTVLISALQLKTQNKKYFEALAKKRVTAIAFDYIKDEHGVFPIVKSLSEIAGIASMHIAAELMTASNGGNGLLLGNIGGVPPTDVVILGAGTVGEFAAKTAIGLGARVKVFDNSITKLRNLQSCVQAPIYTSTIQPKTLQKALMRCDVAIGAIRGKDRSPVVVTEEMIEQMKDGAVIVDVSIDRGGCFETSQVTTHSKPTFSNHGVIHYCVPNIPSRYSRTASVSISNIFTPYLLEIAEEGGFENAARFDKSLRNGMYFYHGILTNKTVADWFDLPYRDINLLIL